MTKGSKIRLLRPDLTGYSALEGTLAEVRLAAASLGRFNIAEDGFLQMQGVPYLFVVLEGTHEIVADDSQIYRIGAGDSILSLRGDAVMFGKQPPSKVYTDIAEVWSQNAAPPATSEGYDRPVEIDWGSSGNRCRLLGSSMVLSRTTRDLSLIRNAPDLLVVPASETRLDLMTHGFDQMLDDEISHSRHGFPAQSKAIAHFVLIQILRSYLTHHAPSTDDLLATHRTRGVAMLLKALRDAPERDWSMQDMAREASMSRTTFFDHFSRITGTTPFRYLGAMRIDVAARLLKNSTENIAEIAHRVGYRSNAAFVTAFKERHGITPSAYRRSRRNRGDLSD